MKLFLVIGEDHFYHPELISNFISQTKDEIVGAALVTKPPVKANLQKYLIKHFYYLTPLELVKLFLFSLKAIIASKFFKEHYANKRKFFSVKSVFDYKKIDYFEVQVNINKSEYLDKIRTKNPDVIISSNPCIFKEEILNLPKICCINRHSSLLPSYAGLWPVFYAATHGEKYTGVTIHTMVKEIDKGIILSQKKVEIKPKDSVSDLYKKTYAESLPALLESLERIRKNDFVSIKNDYKGFYFSFPVREDWVRFRELGGIFI